MDWLGDDLTVKDVIASPNTPTISEVPDFAAGPALHEQVFISR
jgi:hypothetical protein